MSVSATQVTQNSVPNPSPTPVPSQPSAKSRFIRRMFDTIAPDYDRLNTWVSLGLDHRWRRRAARLMPNDGWIADWCAGTGDLARAYLRRKGTSGRVVLCDFSAEMRRLHEAKFTTAEKARMFYVSCDVTRAPFRDGVFNGQLMGFSLRNLTSRTAFFMEAARCSASDGRGALVDLANPRVAIWRWACRIHFTVIAPMMVSLLARRGMYAYRYLAESIRRQPPPEQIVAEMRSAGLPGAGCRLLAGGVGALFHWGWTSHDLSRSVG